MADNILKIVALPEAELKRWNAEQEALQKRDWSIAYPPPEGHEDVGKFFWDLYWEAKTERERLGKPDQWFKAYCYFKGNHWHKSEAKSKQTKVSANLFFSNVVRTTANIVNRNPVAEVEDLTGRGGDISRVVTRKLEKWWIESKQHKKLRLSVINNETYGVTVEKPFWNSTINSPDTANIDPFTFFPAPGYWEDITLDAPYACQAIPVPVPVLQKQHGIDSVSADDVYYDLGLDREEHSSVVHSSETGRPSGYSGGSLNSMSRDAYGRGNLALKVEIWIRVNRSEKYPDGIRCVTICNNGQKVLADRPNPLINWAMPEDKVKTNFLYGKIPFFLANSYEDTSSVWGFSALDQTYELAVKIEELVSMAIAYHMRSASGVMVVSQNSGIKRKHLNSRPGLVLFPLTDVNSVKFLPLPSLPSSYFNLIDLLINLHDRIYAVQDADRGENPEGVRAASAIVALQERNAVLIQHKIDAVEKLIEARGMCAIALYQMHGHIPETIEVDGEAFQFKGTDLIGDSFNYVVHSGSTMIQTRVQKQEQSVSLYKEDAIDQQALLEDLGYPKAKQVLERMAEGQLETAMSIMVQAGMPEEQALEIMQVLQQQQFGNNTSSENEGGQSGMSKPGVPVAQQGEIEQAGG
jgi:hypothetical protein